MGIFSAVTDLFGGAATKIAIYAIGGLLAIGTLTAVYYSWQSHIKHEALLEYNNTQLKQVVEDLHGRIKTQEDLIKLHEDALNALNKRNAEVDTQSKSAEDFINSAEAHAVDRPAGPILKKTFELLGSKP